jgi:hypothetical protein
MQKKILTWFLILSGLIQVFYFGCSHLFFPVWYLQSAGINTSVSNLGDILMLMHEIGVLAAALGVATLLAAADPIKNFTVIILMYVVSIGSMLTSIYHILFKGAASGEWGTVAIIAIQVAILTVLYPWKELKR